MSGTRYLDGDLDSAGDFNIDNIVRELAPFAYVLKPGAQPFATLELHERCEMEADVVFTVHGSGGSSG